MDVAERSTRNAQREEWFGVLPWLAAASLLIGGIIGMRRAPALWFDEVCTLITISDPSFKNMIHGMAIGAEGAPPFYHVLARMWGTLFGFSQGPLRLFSLLGFMAALVATHALLRRYYSQRAAAYATVVVFAGSELLCTFTLQLRYYGLLVLLVVLVSWAACLVMESANEPTGHREMKPLVLLGLSISALLYTHVFGIVYSAVIVAAILVSELLHRKRIRMGLLIAIALAFLSFVPWIPAFRAQIAVSGSDLYIPPPGPRTALQTYELDVRGFVIYIALLVAASAVVTNGRAALSVNQARRRSAASIRLIGVALFTVPFATAAASYVMTPLFNPKYMLPCVLGLAILIAEVADGLAATTRVDTSPRRGFAADLLLLSGAAIALIMPVFQGARRDVTTRPDLALESQIDPALRALPIALEASLDYVPMWYYAGKPHDHFIFVMDSAAGRDPLAARGALAQIRLARAWKKAGYSPDIAEAEDFLAGHDRFVVVDYPDLRFFEHRIRGNPAWTHCRIGTFQRGAVRLVVRRGMTLEHCRDDD